MSSNKCRLFYKCTTTRCMSFFGRTRLRYQDVSKNAVEKEMVERVYMSDSDLSGSEDEEVSPSDHDATLRMMIVIFVKAVVAATKNGRTLDVKMKEISLRFSK
ncbi:hypothetical protein Syun_016759 [Stephania yunnanensis]|uniref:Uncharacterized protein n=1 Tax=Stephania yunnanensis TaxID=152371 RepID=A0AAP0J5D2_9MAGN